MSSLKEIRNRIQSVSSTQKITRAMKLVAASKMRKAVEVLESTRKFSVKFDEIVGRIYLSAGKETRHPLLQTNDSKKVLFIVVTSNKGLAGAFNTNAIKALNQALQAELKNVSQADLSILSIGKKGYDYFKRRYDNVQGEVDIFKNIDTEGVAAIGQKIIEAYAQGEYARVELVYNSFKSTANQEVVRDLLLPFKIQEKVEKTSETTDFLIEPDANTFLETVLPQAILTKLLKSIVDSNASEQAARMMAMSNATDNAQELIKTLKLDYNQARQASVTKELLEIVSGANALEEQG